MLLTWQNGIIKDVVEQTPNTKSFFIESLDTPAFHFNAGQFVTLDLPINPRPSQRLRSYSIASWPDGSNIFELLISHKEGGIGTTYLFDEGRPGHEVKFRGPLGNFILPDRIEKDSCMICTGTGVAPFRSQLQYLFRNNRVEKDIHLIFGARYMKDILYHDELKALEKEHPNFHYHIALSRETSPEWVGHKGYVHDVYTSICDNGKKPFDFYLCGWRNMIEEARQRLQEMGYTRHDVHLESYD